MRVSSYSMGQHYRPLLIGGYAVMLVVAGVIVWSQVSGNLAGLLLALLFAGAVLYVGYGLLWKTAFELALDECVLTWRTPLRSGSVPVGQLRGVTRHRVNRNVEVIEFGDGSQVQVIARRGLDLFLEDLTRCAPGLRVEVDRRLFETYQNRPGPSGYSGRDV